MQCVICFSMRGAGRNYEEEEQMLPNICSSNLTKHAECCVRWLFADTLHGNVFCRRVLCSPMCLWLFTWCVKVVVTSDVGIQTRTMVVTSHSSTYNSAQVSCLPIYSIIVLFIRIIMLDFRLI